MPLIRWQEECSLCQGSGIVTSPQERAGTGIVCKACVGTGCRNRVLAYDEFVGKRLREDIKWVYATNPGIVGLDGNFMDGGVMYRDFVNNPASPSAPGAEPREFFCPAWWYQSVDIQRNPRWAECESVPDPKLFRECPMFWEKEDCWKRWDSEFGDR